MNVANRKCIRRLSLKSMKSAKLRNAVAVAAIALTTVLFTSLFTIAMSIVYGYEQSNFRQVGGYAHGAFKYLTKEQFDELKDDPLIREYGMRRFVGMASGDPFRKSHVEVGYSDENQAKWMFLEPAAGRLPEEGTDEAATDTAVLTLLGVEPRIGEKFTMTFDVDGVETTETFTLSGFWEYDEAIVANHVLLPESRAEDIFGKLHTEGKDGMTGLYNMDVMLKSNKHIQRDINTILERHGFQNQNRGEDAYIATGVNWGYVSAQIMKNIDPGTVLGLAVLILLIIFTGYLIIYNVFQVSVTNEIRHYGLLKTIGTTGRQIRRIILIQAMLLSALGIPVGLVLGYGTGILLTPMVSAQLDGIQSGAFSANPVIFAGAAFFSLVTVLISCRRPGRIAAKVSPIEALRFSEGKVSKKSKSRTGKGASIFKMAWKNLGRSRKKTFVTVLSLALSVVLLNMTYTFTKGFDMNKYLARMAADFIIADTGYFQVGNGLWGTDKKLPAKIAKELESFSGVAEGGRTYGLTGMAGELLSEEQFRRLYEGRASEENILSMIDQMEKEGQLIVNNAQFQLSGMEDFCLDKTRVLVGDIEKLKNGGRYIAAVLTEDDYGRPYMDSHWAKVGDKVVIRYTEEKEYYNLQTGQVYEDLSAIGEEEDLGVRSVKYRDVEYEVAALITVPHSLSYRYHTGDTFVLGAETFKRDTGTDGVMYYAFDMEENADTAQMEEYLRNYTQEVNPQTNYESKETYAKEFESFRSMFLMLGGVLSFIIGLIGILNYINAILTGILARRREFAVIQSVGMTGKQLRQMLIIEGLFYALGSVTASFLFIAATGRLVGNALNGMFWFFTYRFTLLPVLMVTPFFALLGIVIPIIAYRFTANKSIVERLRETE